MRTVATRWYRRKWVIAVLSFVILAPCGIYIYLFVGITPPLSVEVVDAITGKPLHDMDVCMQAIDDGFNYGGGVNALRSVLLSTDANGKVFFWPTINTMSILGHWGGYSLQVSDPNSNFNISCGSHVGFALEHFRDDLAASRTDGTQYFPVELVRRPISTSTVQRFLPWTNQHQMDSNVVHLIPILPNPQACDQIHNSQSQEECKQFNAETESAILQDMLPQYFAGMIRVIAKPFGDGMSASADRIQYIATYSTQSIPADYVVIMIEQFSDARIAMDHQNDLLHAIPNYDRKMVTDDEIIPGQKIKWIKEAQTSRAFWISGQRLILITFPRPVVNDRNLVVQWVIHHPSTAVPEP